MSILTITGGQYGSEGKGVIAHHLAPNTGTAVRTGGPNAGHTILHQGRLWKMRSVPVAWTNQDCHLIIGPGAVIDPETLVKEVDDLEEAGYLIRPRLFVDKRATIITKDDRAMEGAIGLLERVGSTLEGVGMARIRRIQRHPDQWFTPEDVLTGAGIQVVDTIPIVNLAAIDSARGTMLEGTQGYGLSLTYGTWPYVTSQNCHSAQLVADSGIGAHMSVLVRNLLVFRSYPIRVGGNSGPLHGETTWDAMSERLGRPVLEHTTVTGKVRRIGTFDWELAAEAVIVNDPAILALTFADYIDPVATGMTWFDDLTRPVRLFIDQMEARLGVPVAYVGTGGDNLSVIDRYPTGNRRHPRSGEDDRRPLLV